MKKPLRARVMRRLRAVVRAFTRRPAPSRTLHAALPTAPTDAVVGGLDTHPEHGPFVLRWQPAARQAVILAPPRPSMDGWVRPRLQRLIASGFTALDGEDDLDVERRLAELAQRLPPSTIDMQRLAWTRAVRQAAALLRQARVRSIIVRRPLHDPRAYEGLDASVVAFGRRSDWDDSTLERRLEAVARALSRREDDFDRGRALEAEIAADRFRRIWSAETLPWIAIGDAPDEAAVARLPRPILVICRREEAVDALRARGIAACRLPRNAGRTQRIAQLELTRAILTGLRALLSELEPSSPEWIAVHWQVGAISDHCRQHVIARQFAEAACATMRGAFMLDGSALASTVGTALRHRGIPIEGPPR